MKNKELIELLQKQDPEQDVWMQGEYDYVSVSKVFVDESKVFGNRTIIY